MLRLVVQCDYCPAIVEADDRGPITRSARTVARDQGWSQDAHGRDKCPRHRAGG